MIFPVDVRIFYELSIRTPSTLHLGHFFPLRFAQGFALTLDLHGTKTTTTRVFEKPKSGWDRLVRHADWGSPVAPRNTHVTEVSILKKWLLHKTNRTSKKKHWESRKWGMRKSSEIGESNGKISCKNWWT